MDHDVVVYLGIEGDTLESIFINMDSKALLSYRSKLNKEETLKASEARFVSSVYFHTLFLYTITKNRKYGFIRQSSDNGNQQVEVADYIADLFNTFYAQFLLNFDTQKLIAALEA